MMRKHTYWIVSAILLLLPAAGAQPRVVDAKACMALANLSLPQTRIAAEFIPAGALPPQAAISAELSSAYKELPAFCRVRLQLTPTADSDIKVEVWLPAAGWNGKFRGQGNGGFAGEIDYSGLAWALSHGYATAGTDTGHAASFIDASWALHHPEKIADFGYRGIHQMTVSAKSLVKSFYGSPEQKAYFASCSDGGREALMEAQRFPGDYNGILAGAPANKWTGLVTNAASNAKALSAQPQDYIPAAKLPALSAAVLAACDALDGVKDGVLNDPRQCHFDPAALLCKGAETDKCLNPRQIATLKVLYAGARTSDGKLVFPGYLPGAEDGPGGWLPWITGAAPGKDLMSNFAKGYFSDMVYDNEAWDLKTFNLDAALKLAQEKTGQSADATDPDLKAFIARGGKLVLYHGWNDPAISALNTIDYYEQVLAATGRQGTESAVRLYMAPGVQHCGGGPGPDSFGQSNWEAGPEANNPAHDIYQALEQWVEHGVAPGAIIATKYAESDHGRQPVVTRPLCAYPLASKYKGSGDTKDAASFVCAAPEK